MKSFAVLQGLALLQSVSAGIMVRRPDGDLLLVRRQDNLTLDEIDDMPGPYTVQSLGVLNGLLSNNADQFQYLELAPEGSSKSGFDGSCTYREDPQIDLLALPYSSRDGEVFLSYQEQFQNGSECFWHDYKIAVILDVVSTYSDFASSFTQLNARICPEGTTEGSSETCNLPSELATVDDVQTSVGYLQNRIITFMDSIDAWTCREQLTDRSATYFTLFLREEKDLVLKKPEPSSPDTEFDTYLHAADFLTSILTTLQPNSIEFATDLNGVIDNVKTRFARTKSLMEAFGSGTGTLDQIGDNLAYCVSLGTFFKFEQTSIDAEEDA
ncbi:hypothetical protein TWF694_001388 [Orbilia ellipsospora]|uniref:Uncharacterized protein n=1 Tax=Orbilia ellipsospora TaxID=2528407 RepID=A0AAV9XUU8_9PEZI